MNTKELEKFLYEARTLTYAAGTNKVSSLLEGTKQYEFAKDDFLYRDVFYSGKNGFMGLEGILYKGKPVFSVSYYGEYHSNSQDEIDRILQEALVANPETRSYKSIEWKENNYRYVLEPDIAEGIENIAGVERIFRGTNEIYTFYYGGQLLV